MPSSSRCWRRCCCFVLKVCLTAAELLTQTWYTARLPSLALGPCSCTCLPCIYCSRCHKTLWNTLPKPEPLIRGVPLPLPCCRSAAKTLLFYFSELNPTLMQWLEYFMKANPIPQASAAMRGPAGCQHEHKRAGVWASPACLVAQQTACLVSKLAAHMLLCPTRQATRVQPKACPGSRLERRGLEGQEEGSLTERSRAPGLAGSQGKPASQQLCVSTPPATCRRGTGRMCAGTPSCASCSACRWRRRAGISTVGGST